MVVANWPEARTPVLIPPGLDAVSGRSYKQAHQTPGALGGRRDKSDWYYDGIVNGSSGQIVKVSGGLWRLVDASARVRVAPTGATINVDILAGGVSIFSTVLSIAVGQTEATGGVLVVNRLLPLGTLISVSNGTDGVARDLTIELHYRLTPVGQ